MLSVRHPDLSFLHGALQLHTGLRECGQGAAPIQREIHHGQIIQPVELRQIVRPPLVGATTSVGIDADLFRASARPANGLLLGLANLDPEIDGARQILAPESRFLLGAQPTAE